MAQVKNLKKEDGVIYYGYAFPRRRGEFCRINEIIDNKTVIIVFDSDKFSTECSAGYLKKMELSPGES